MIRPSFAKLVVVAVLVTASAIASPQVRAIKTTDAARAAYLGEAVIWRDPGPLSPSDLLDGPAGAFPFTFAQANPPGGIPCTFKEPGKTLGGASPKFRCALEGGEPFTLKYWDPASAEGSREVFAAVAASRLLAALGFGVRQQLPVTIRCLGCPADPMEGTGDRGDRLYVGVLSQPGTKPPIISDDDLDEGWSWEDLHEAIEALPPGPDRARQRTHFDALTLLGVLVQHGDRKPEQQVLYCDELAQHATANQPDPDPAREKTTLVERPGEPACLRAAVALYDVGATFGGAGLATKSSTAKMNLERWRDKSVFKDEAGVCRGNLTVSMAAGEEGKGDPVISEEGRAFLVQQLRRLTREHVRAIFTAARAGTLDKSGNEPNEAEGMIAGVDAWVAAFDTKVAEIEGRRCPAGR